MWFWWFVWGFDGVEKKCWVFWLKIVVGDYGLIVEEMDNKIYCILLRFYLFFDCWLLL